MITRTSFPNFVALTPAEVQEWLRIDDGVDPMSVMMLIASATDIIEGITGLTILQANYAVTIPPTCDTMIELTISPLQSITTVTVPDSTGTASLVVGWTLAGSTLTLAAPVPGPLTINVVAGFASHAAIPDSIRHAIAVIVAAGYDSRSQIDDQTMTTVNRLVAQYRRFA